jgi:hypothetical protein
VASLFNPLSIITSRKSSEPVYYVHRPIKLDATKTPTHHYPEPDQSNGVDIFRRPRRPRPPRRQINPAAKHDPAQVAYHGSIVQWLSDMVKEGSRWYHITIAITAPSDEYLLKAAIRLMRASNRYVLGKNRRRKIGLHDKFAGIIMFEEGRCDAYSVHAHIIARAPTGGHHMAFLELAKAVFDTARKPPYWYDPEKGGWLAKSGRGSMLVQDMNFYPDQLDTLLRAESYASKELRWKSELTGTWRVLG